MRHLGDEYTSPSHGKYVAVWCLYQWNTVGTEHQHVCTMDARQDHHHRCRCKAIQET